MTNFTCSRTLFFLVTTLLLASCGGSSDDQSGQGLAEQANENTQVEQNSASQNNTSQNNTSNEVSSPDSQTPVVEQSGTSEQESSEDTQVLQAEQNDNSNQDTQNNQENELQNNPQNNPQNNQSTQTTKRILPLGDSITNGGDGFPSYRRSLWFMLRNGDYDVDFIGSQRGFDGPVDDALKDFDLDHEGHWAWETGELEQSLPGWINRYTPDIVLLHAGTNDVDRGQSHGSTISELDGIIDILRNKNPNVVVLLAKIIPMQNRDTADFNEFIESFSVSKHTSISPVVIVDQHEGYFPSSDNHDNYHPNDRGEEKMATRWLNALQPYLN